MPGVGDATWIDDSYAFDASMDVAPGATAGGKTTTIHGLRLLDRKPENATWVETQITLSPATPLAGPELRLLSDRLVLNATTQPRTAGAYYLVVENDSAWRGELALVYRPANDSVAMSVRVDVHAIVHTRSK